MGQIVNLGMYRQAEPAMAADLPKPDCVLLLAVRCWVDSFKRQEDPMPRLSQGLGIAGAPEATFSIDSLMTIIARTGQRPIDIGCPRCPRLSQDERLLLHAAHLVQCGHIVLAEQALVRHMLTEEGGQFAIGPLEGIAVLFAQAGLMFREGGNRQTSDDDQDGWGNPACNRHPPTIH